MNINYIGNSYNEAIRIRPMYIYHRISLIFFSFLDLFLSPVQKYLLRVTAHAVQYVRIRFDTDSH